MATITLNQVRTNEVDNTYKVVNTLKNEVDIPKELFALQTTTGAFSHVVNVGEISTLPLVDTVGYSFYRSEVAEKSYPDVAGAIAFAEDLKRRVDILLNEYTPEVAAFEGTEDTNYPLPIV